MPKAINTLLFEKKDWLSISFLFANMAKIWKTLFEFYPKSIVTPA